MGFKIEIIVAENVLILCFVDFMPLIRRLIKV